MLRYISDKKNDSFVFKMFPTVHLGDIIVSMNMLYNFCLQKKMKAKFYTHNGNVVTQLLHIFDYDEKIEIINNLNVPCRHPFTIGHFLSLGKSRNQYWCGHLRGYMSIPPEALNVFTLPKINISLPTKGNYLCYQIDSHSNYTNKKPKMKPWELKKIIEKFGNENSYFIGKTGTKKMFHNQKTHFASLVDQAKFLLGCERFFGVDSGMSHLAGTLGIIGDVVTQQLEDIFISCVTNAYEFMYPTITVHKRKSLRL